MLALICLVAKVVSNQHCSNCVCARGFCAGLLFCGVVLSVISSFSIILLRKRGSLAFKVVLLLTCGCMYTVSILPGAGG